MPVGASARLKGHTAAAGTHLIVGRVQRVNTHIAGKKLLRPLAGSLLTVTDNRLRLAHFRGKNLPGRKPGCCRQSQGHAHHSVFHTIVSH